MGTVHDAQSALLGVHRLNEKGVSEFDQAPFISYVQKENSICLLDEISRAPLAANNILFPCLDKRRYLPLDIACESGERHVKVNPDVCFIATANLGAEYTGTHSIDRALYDRFFPVELEYPTEDVEQLILEIHTGVDKKIAKSIVSVSKGIRRSYAAQELSNNVSVRHTIMAASMVKDGWTIKEALEKVILPLFEDTADGTDSERTKVKGMMTAL